MQGIAWLLILLPLTACAQDPARDATTRLYLASAAINVLDELIPLLTAHPDGHSACYITTAGNLEGKPQWMEDEIAAVERTGLEVTRIDLEKLSPRTVESAFDGCDSIWVGGGNTYFLLQEVRRSGFDKLAIRKISAGIPYVGTSAGSLLLGPNLRSIRFAEEHPDLDLRLASLDGLNVFPLLPFVHFDNPAFKDVYRKILSDALENDAAFVTLRDNQFIFVEGENWRIVDSN